MTDDLPPAELGKRAAAAKALEFVEGGMKLGLGTGSTAKWFVDLVPAGSDEVVRTIATALGPFLVGCELVILSPSGFRNPAIVPRSVAVSRTSFGGSSDQSAVPAVARGARIVSV